MRVAVAGVGNRLYGDDGIGEILAEALLECGASGFDVLVAPGGGVELLPVLTGYDSLVFVDAVDPSLGGRAGSVVVLEVEPERPGGRSKRLPSLDPHEVNPAALASLLMAMGYVKGRALVVRVVPERVGLGGPLSEVVLRSVPRLLRTLRACLRELGATPSWDDRCMAEAIKRLARGGASGGGRA